ncbi:hypothetical protein IWQ62_005925 [Dispira parvispora]|uniref:Secreted protein n=1 Tax=Dispira parvispora TaxID=1520584 RepID=A0A9W8AQ21_9FUNG|nr:hypothetical protein IWQ62_005925 [Dispira parvispora]
MQPPYTLPLLLGLTWLSGNGCYGASVGTVDDNHHKPLLPTPPSKRERKVQAVSTKQLLETRSSHDFDPKGELLSLYKLGLTFVSLPNTSEGRKYPIFEDGVDAALPSISDHEAKELLPLWPKKPLHLKLKALKVYCPENSGVSSRKTDSQPNTSNMDTPDDFESVFTSQVLEMMGKSDNERIFPLYIGNVKLHNNLMLKYVEAFRERKTLVVLGIEKFQHEPTVDVIKLSDTDQLSCEQLTFELSQSYPFFRIIVMEPDVDIANVQAIATKVLDNFKSNNQAWISTFKHQQHKLLVTITNDYNIYNQPARSAPSDEGFIETMKDLSRF